MIFFASFNHRLLDSLAAELAAARREVPARCHGFERSASHLEADLRECRKRRRPSQEELTRLRERTKDLTAASAEFASLAAGLLTSEERVGGLRREAEAAGDVDVRRWLAEQCDGWQRHLALLGQAQRPAELGAEKRRLAEVESEVQLAAEGLSALSELARSLAALPGDVAVAPLAARLSALREQVLSSRATREWLQQVRRFLAPLSSLRPAERPASPQHSVVPLVTSLQSWSLATCLRTEEVAGLVPRLLWGSDDGEPLIAEARRLLDSLLAEARAEREGLLRSLGDLVRALVEGCGRQEEVTRLEAGLEELVRATVVEPADHKTWLDRRAALYADLAALAAALERTLTQDFSAHLARLGRRLDSLRMAELPADLNPDVASLLDRHHRLAGIGGWRDVLLHRQEIEQMRARIDALEAEIASEQEVARTLGGRLRPLLDELQALPDCRLRPQERAERKLCLDELQQLAAAPPADLRLRRRALEGAVSRAEELLERRRQGQARAAAMKEGLARRLATFHRASYGLFSTTMVDRVEALVYGVPSSPREWTAAEQQLAAADRLLARLERLGSRTAAARVEALAGLLRQSQHRASDPGSRREIAALLGELERAESADLPPARWRRRAEDLIRRGVAPSARGAMP